MIAAWMLFTLATGLLLCSAAWLSERALLIVRAPLRGVWMAAMLLATLLPLGAWLAPPPSVESRSTGPTLATLDPHAVHPAVFPIDSILTSDRSRGSVASGGVVPDANDATARAAITSTIKMNAPSSTQSSSLAGAKSLASSYPQIASWRTPFKIEPHSMLERLSGVLMKGWLALSGLAVIVCLLALLQVIRERVRWSREHIDGMPVLVSHDVGPALVGVLRYSIVIPRWAFALNEQARRLVIAHEREHARAFDPLLLAVGVLLIVIAPWNVASWLMFRRLRLAVEMDCDQRVLRVHSDSRMYGALLLDVAERALPSPMPSAALVENGTSLERRIAAIVRKSVRYRALRASANVVGVAVLMIAACVAPRPYASLPPAQRASRLASDLASVLRGDSTGSAVSASDRAAVVQTVREAADTPARSTADVNTNTLKSGSTEMSMHDRVATYAPLTLGQWPRRDSTLVMLLNADGTLAKVFASRVDQEWLEREPAVALAGLYLPSELASFNVVGAVSVERGLKRELLNQPLAVLWARLAPGVAIPRTRNEVTPTQAQMVETLRAAHAEIFDDKSAIPLIGTLLYDTHGTLLATAAVRMNESRLDANGEPKPNYEDKVLRSAFGSLLDSMVVFDIGMRAYFDETTPHDGLPRLIYALVAKRSSGIHDGMIGDNFRNSGLMLGGSGFSSRVPILSATQVMNSRFTDQQLANIVRAHVPAAYDVWSRGDSAVYLVFDADNQLIEYTGGPRPEKGDLSYLANLLSRKTGAKDPDEIVSVGHAEFVVDDEARLLNKPLMVIWGRLQRGAALSDKSPRRP